MEKAVLNVETLNITQGMNGSYSHKGDLAIDMGSVCKNLKAPFTGTIKRIYKNCNAVWLESNSKVKYADGTEDYMTVMTLHDNDVSNLYVGKVIKQGEIYYQPGVKGLGTGSHIHIAVGRGKFSGTGWYKGQYQSQCKAYAWYINNQYDITKALFLYDGVKVSNGVYNWNKTKDFTYYSGIVVGDKVKIGTMPNAKKWVADDVQKKYGMYQIKEIVNAGNSFTWAENGIPEGCVDLTDKNGKKRADSDRVHAKKGDCFVFAKTFTVRKIAIEKGKRYFYLSYDINPLHRFWVVSTYCKRV